MSNGGEKMKDFFIIINNDLFGIPIWTQDSWSEKPRFKSHTICWFVPGLNLGRAISCCPGKMFLKCCFLPGWLWHFGALFSNPSWLDILCILIGWWWLPLSWQGQPGSDDSSHFCQVHSKTPHQHQVEMFSWWCSNSYHVMWCHHHDPLEVEWLFPSALVAGFQEVSRDHIWDLHKDCENSSCWNILVCPERLIARSAPGL